MTFVVAGAAAVLAAATPVAHRPAPPLPPYAAILGRVPQIEGPALWRVVSDREAWTSIASALPAQRQAARWAYARSLIGRRRGAEARGVLHAMLRDDSELAIVQPYRLALAAADVEAGHAGSAATILAEGPNAVRGSEACAWRLRAFASYPAAVLAQFNCALPALNARSIAARRPFLIATAQSALAAGRPDLVKRMLRVLPQADIAAGLERGHAALALGDLPEARRQLARVRSGGGPQQRVAAELALLEHDFDSGGLAPAEAGKAADRLALVWRGDLLERRTLLLSYRVWKKSDDLTRRLAAGAALVRHFPLDAGLMPILAELQTALSRALASDSRLPVDRAAGLYWDYRDLAPAGAAGDYLVSQLADRLQERGLYARAADLLKHLMMVRTKDIAQGPLSVRVGSLYILAGRPGDALAALRATDGIVYPPEMGWARHRIEAVALLKFGRVAEALAVIQDVPDAGILQAEIFWQRRDWPALATATEAKLPVAGHLGQVDQVIVLRHAIALAMLAREPALAALRLRYLAGFQGTAGQSSFDLLTRDATTVDERLFTQAMLALPQVSPVADIGDLFDAPATPAAMAPGKSRSSG